MAGPVKRIPPLPENPTKPRLFGRYWQGYLSPHWVGMGIVLVLMVIDGGILGAVSKLIQPLFDKVLVPGGASAVIGVGMTFLGLFVLRAAVSAQ